MSFLSVCGGCKIVDWSCSFLIRRRFLRFRGFLESNFQAVRTGPEEKPQERVVLPPEVSFHYLPMSALVGADAADQSSGDERFY